MIDVEPAKVHVGEQMVEGFNSKKPIFVEGRKFISSWKLLRGKINDERF